MSMSVWTLRVKLSQIQINDPGCNSGSGSDCLNSNNQTKGFQSSTWQRALSRLLVAGWKVAACLVLLSGCRVFSWSAAAAVLRAASRLFERLHWAQVRTRKSLLSFLVALCRELQRRRAECDATATKPAAEEEECVFVRTCVRARDGGRSEVKARRGGSHGAPEPGRAGLFDLWPLRPAEDDGTTLTRDLRRERRRRRRRRLTVACCVLAVFLLHSGKSLYVSMTTH